MHLNNLAVLTIKVWVPSSHMDNVLSCDRESIGNLLSALVQISVGLGGTGWSLE